MPENMIIFLDSEACDRILKMKVQPKKILDLVEKRKWYLSLLEEQPPAGEIGGPCHFDDVWILPNGEEKK